MFVALNEKDERVFAEDAIKGNDYYCPVCKEKLMLKQGDINAWHFAHLPDTECLDNWTHDMSEWHKKMQDLFPKECQEIVVNRNGKIHRADVLQNGIVVEMQHSPISQEEFVERNNFYLDAGYKLVWIFDANDANIEWDNDRFVRWKNPKRVLSSAKKIGKNNSDFAIWLYMTEPDGNEFIEKVIWAARNWSRYLPSINCSYTLSLIRESGCFNAYYLVETLKQRIKRKLKKYKNIQFRIRTIRDRGYSPNTGECPKNDVTDLYLDDEKGCTLCECCGLIVNTYKENYDTYCSYPIPCRKPNKEIEIIDA